jgi:hypothetical protein
MNKLKNSLKELELKIHQLSQFQLNYLIILMPFVNILVNIFQFQPEISLLALN